MLGSEHGQYLRRDGACLSVFQVELGGRSLWGWRLRAEDGTVQAQCQDLFRNYVACLCAALRHVNLR
jgi:hypothetical protein